MIVQKGQDSISSSKIATIQISKKGDTNLMKLSSYETPDVTLRLSRLVPERVETVKWEKIGLGASD